MCGFLSFVPFTCLPNSGRFLVHTPPHYKSARRKVTIKEPRSDVVQFGELSSLFMSLCSIEIISILNCRNQEVNEEDCDDI